MRQARSAQTAIALSSQPGKWWLPASPAAVSWKGGGEAEKAQGQSGLFGLPDQKAWTGGRSDKHVLLCARQRLLRSPSTSSIKLCKPTYLYNRFPLLGVEAVKTKHSNSKGWRCPFHVAEGRSGSSVQSCAGLRARLVVDDVLVPAGCLLVCHQRTPVL